MYLLKYVNQTREFVFIMDPQLPAPDSQGLIPVRLFATRIQIGQDVNDLQKQNCTLSLRRQ